MALSAISVMRARHPDAPSISNQTVLPHGCRFISPAGFGKPLDQQWPTAAEGLHRDRSSPWHGRCFVLNIDAHARSGGLHADAY